MAKVIPIPEGFEAHPDPKNKTLWCCVCAQGDPYGAGPGKWIVKSSAKKHLESGNHIHQVTLRLAEQSWRKALHEQVEELLQAADYHDQYGYDNEEDDLAMTNIYYKLQAHGESINRTLQTPAIAQHLHFYPKETEGTVSEVWQTQRWREYLPSELTPMFSWGYHQFFIEEVIELDNGSLVVPKNLIMQNQELHSDCLSVEIRSEQAQPPTMPNPLQNLVEADEDLVVIMVPIWCDDVSGNKSKQFNKHMNLYMSNGQQSEIRYDNPQQSEQASHIGGNGNCKCRKCKVGGQRDNTESNEGYHAFYAVNIQTYLSTSKMHEQIQIQLDTAAEGVKKSVTDLQTSTGVKDKVAQFWINKLLAMFSAKTKENPQQSSEDIADELHDWLHNQPGDKMNPLLDIADRIILIDNQVWIQHKIHLSKFYIPFSSGILAVAT
ncbi:hypothetical protein EDD18DRAFT_1107480 [Armillaria luteobubalina]|uniref:Uncharacterized protein n=1 Tax=Armillaria luteobubalina TaxID=153913 RepID=A0AA39UL87_9AGAR|nr:hypothetical protein EDD18DRAFT_1107480 [Armillaria luteobubalina]